MKHIYLRHIAEVRIDKQWWTKELYFTDIRIDEVAILLMRVLMK